MLTFQQHKNKILQLFDQTISIAKNQKDNNLEKYLQEAKSYLHEEKIYVVVCGEFKQGKSSLINAFIDEKNLFPVDVRVTTNLISTITYGKEEKITVILGDIGQGKPKQITRDEIPNYVTEQQNKGNYKNARMLIIESPNPHLKEGLVLVDTPGTGSLNSEHTALTYSFIPNADVILFVSDIQSPLKEEDLKFIDERILPHCQNIIFVVTKIDAIVNYQTIVNSNQEKIFNLLQSKNIFSEEISIIPVSSKAKQDYLQYQDEEDLQESHFPELQEKVWSIVKEKRGQILLLKALTQLGRSLTQIKLPLEIEWQSYQEENKEELNRWEEEIKQTQKQLQDLLQNNAQWQTDLRDGMKLLRIDVQNKFQNEFVKIQRKSNQYLDNPTFLNNPQQIASLLESDIEGMIVELGKELNLNASNLYGEIEQKSNLNFSPFVARSLDVERVNIKFEPIQIKTGIVEKAATLGRTGMFNAGAGAFVGGLLGAIAGGAIGILSGGIATIPAAILGSQWGAYLGGIAGSTRGAIEGFKEVTKLDQSLVKQEITKVIKELLEDTQRLSRQALDKQIEVLEKLMRDELTSQIKRQKESYDKTLRSLQDGRKLSEKQRNQRANELQVPLQKLLKIQQSVEQLMVTITTKKETVKPQTTPNLPQTPISPTDDNADYGDWADDD